MKAVLLDTNMLMTFGQLKIDIFSEIDRICSFPYKIKVLSGSLNELDKIAKIGKGRDKSAASLARSLVDKFKIPIVESGGFVDDELVDLAQKGAIIATNDAELKKRLKILDVECITVRKKQYLVLIN